MTGHTLISLTSLEAQLMPLWQQFETTCHTNTARIMQAFARHRLSDTHFASVTGYGHNDQGREVTDKIFADALQAEAALVRMQFVSGTHAIQCALRGALTGERNWLVSLTGKPYDTLEEVIGIRGESPLSLKAQGIYYAELDVLKSGTLDTTFVGEDWVTLQLADVVFIQRSRGYSDRPSLSITEIETLIKAVRKINPNVVVVVDNCYGEFIETQEPTAIGADLIAGSLIKNPGGGIVSSGGYVAGRADLVALAAEVLTCPGVGAKGGYTFESTRSLLQGLYLAPTVTTNALKSMSLFRQAFAEQGYEVSPAVSAPMNDIIQRIALGTSEKVLAFCQALQSASPVDAFVTPEPWVTPGYGDPVVMAGGTFIFGSTIELSCDAPMREPYAVFLQGGLSYSHARYALEKIIQAVS